MRSGRVDCQRHPRLCGNAGVRAYPTVRLYEGGGRLDLVGVEVPSLQPEQIVEFTRTHLPRRRAGVAGESGTGSERQRRDEL